MVDEQEEGYSREDHALYKAWSRSVWNINFVDWSAAIVLYCMFDAELYLHP